MREIGEVARPKKACAARSAACEDVSDERQLIVAGPRVERDPPQGSPLNRHPAFDETGHEERSPPVAAVEGQPRAIEHAEAQPRPPEPVELATSPSG